jgi:glycosyltransferase involved in cell wall biosynthesis
MLAERLASIGGWEVEALSTTALDARTWADHFDPGTTDVNGVRVTRFASEAGRAADFDEWSNEVVHNRWLAPATAREWFVRQGPVNPALVDAAATSDADVVVFYPYLYLPAIDGIARVGRRAVLHPAAHDEPSLHLAVLRPTFTSVGGLVFQTEAERALVEAHFPVAAVPQLVLGLGVEEHDGDTAGVPDRPYLLYVGRVDQGKGVRTLVDFFVRYKERRPGDLALVLAGPVVHAPPEHPDVLVTGPLPDEAKWGLYRRAVAFVNPSGYEAFSIVLMEAWTAGLPVIVNGRCGATREHCARSGGGLWFESYAQFESMLDRVGADADLRAELARNGRAYVDANFSWPHLIGRYDRFLRRVASRAR